MKTLIRIGPGGSLRAIHEDSCSTTLRAIGCDPPQRASHVEPIRHGLNAWRWAVDMSPLGDRFTYCLWPPCDRRDQALAAERRHIVDHWIKKE